MKKFTKLLSVFAIAAAVVSCENADMDDLGSSSGGAGNTKGGAYVSVKVVAPATRAGESNVGDQYEDGQEVPGTDAPIDENTVNSVMLVAFDMNYNFIGLYTNKITDVDKYEDKFVFEVAPDAHKFFAIVNVDDADQKDLYDYIVDNTNMWSHESSVQDVLTHAVDYYATSGDFVMVNAGEYGDSLVSITEDKLSTDKENATVVNIPVDRLASKFSYYVPTTFAVTESNAVGNKSDTAEPTGAILGVKLTATNKSSYLYSYITDPKRSGTKGDYRIDPNMKLTETDFRDDNGAMLPAANLPLEWIDNKDFVNDTDYNPFIGIANDAATGLGADNEYVLENTAEAAYYNSNNLTQAIVKAEYIPSAVVEAKANDDDGSKSWFAINVKLGGTQYMTFAQVVEYYDGIAKTITDTQADKATYQSTNTEPGANDPGYQDYIDAIAEFDKTIDTNTAIITAMDTQLNHILGSSDEKWSGTDVTLADLDAVTHGGYVAATVEGTDDNKSANYIVQYYQQGLNYYDVFIQHDSNQDVGILGRWGMVHNNYYELTIGSISAPGVPYIPDPTDPEIVDPENPTPEDPEPADKGFGYIDATIHVNDWTFWEQSADLGGSDFEKK